MKVFKPFLLLVLTALPNIAVGQVATTAGSNLTAWNGNSGATNNNNWNQLTNARVQSNAGAPKADFGNCNSLIMRCAQPKCSGCTTIDIARPIVMGCVNTNATCKQYGNDLVEYIAAQLVATANSKAQQAELAAQNAAAQAAAAQNNMQLQQMQAQMANMQQQMQAQNAQQMQQMQAALEEQRALVAAAQAEAISAKQDNVALNSVELTRAEEERAATGNDTAEMLARERIEGQILSEIESAEDALKNLKSTMQSIFSYAGCDSRGDNCRGPKRVSVFKKKAQQFFDPYDDVADAMYDALEKAMAVGVDVADVVMMLSGACNQWGKYICLGTYDTKTETNLHKPIPYEEGKNCVGGRSKKSGYVKGGMECADGMVVPPQDDTRCTLVELLDGTNNNNEDVQRAWVAEYEEDDKLVRVGCATSSLDTLSVFGRRRSKKQSTLDLDTLEMLISQDAPRYAMNNKYSRNSNSDANVLKYCALSPEGYEKLMSAIQRKRLPNEVCIESDDLETRFYNHGVIRVMAGLERDWQLIPVYSKGDCEYYSNLLKEELRSVKNAPTCEVKWQSIDGSNSECDCENDDCSKLCECRIITGDCVFDNDFYPSKEALYKERGWNDASGGEKNEIKTCADYTTGVTCNNAPGISCKWDGSNCILDIGAIQVESNTSLIKFQGFDQNKSGLTGLGQTILNNFNKSK